MKILNRSYNLMTSEENASGYRYGFNGKEQDFAWKQQDGTIYDYGFRIYDPNTGRFYSVDPIKDEYPWLSTYQYAGNNPIAFIDLEGLERPSRPANINSSGRPRINTSNANRNRQLYSIGRTKQDFDFRKVVERNINKQYKFAESEFYRDYFVNINKIIKIYDPSKPSTSPQGSKESGAFVYRTVKALDEIKKYVERINYQYTDESKMYGQEVSREYDFNTQLYQLQQQYMEQFNNFKLQNTIPKQNLTEEEFAKLSEEEREARIFQAKMKLGPSPLEIANAYLKEAQSSGQTSVVSERTEVTPTIQAKY